MNFLNSIVHTYKSVIHRNKIANINLSDLIRENFESSCAVFKGFFGEPTIDYDLFTTYKNIRVDYPLNKKVRDCQNIVYKFGFDIFTSKTNDGTGFKIMLIPQHDIRAYMIERSLGKEHAQTINLYKRLGGNVI